MTPPRTEPSLPGALLLGCLVVCGSALAEEGAAGGEIPAGRRIACCSLADAQRQGLTTAGSDGAAAPRPTSP